MFNKSKPPTRKDGSKAAPPVITSHGSARLETTAPIRAATVALPMLCRVQHEGRLRDWAYPGDSHLLTVVKTRGGKGRHVILPNLVKYRGSVIVSDPKGENAQFSARWRREKLGQAVHVLDPFGLVGAADLPAEGRAMFNPVHFVRDSSRPYDDAMLVAEALITVSGGKSARWERGAQSILAAYLLYLALDPAFDTVDPTTGEVGPDQRNPQTLWLMISHPAASGAALKRMAASKIKAGNMHVATSAAKLLGPNKEEIGSLLSELEIQTKPFFSSDELLASMERTTVDFGAARDAPSSIYLVLPFDRFQTHGGWLRLLLSIATRQLMGRGVVERGPDGSLPPPVLFIMDEFDSMGRIERIRKGFAELAGYGVQFWAFVQNISQAETTYADGAFGSIIGNCGIIQYFGGTLDKKTRDLLSDLSGKGTIGNTTLTTNTRPESGDGTSQGMIGRPVLFPDEIGRLPKGQQLLFSEEGTKLVGMLNPDRQFGDFPEYRAFMQSPRQARAAE